MQNYPKISIVTPSYNQGQYLEQTILSVIGQNYPNLEYIIIDGGSTDNSVEIIKKYEKHLAYWVSEKDSGQSEAINKGLEKCTGEIFNWINSDDLLTPNSLQQIGIYFAENEIDVLCGYTNVFEGEINDTISYYRSSVNENVSQTIIRHTISQQSLFFKTNLVKEIGGVSENLVCVMDLELWFKYLLKYGQAKIKLVENHFADFRIHNSSKTAQIQEIFDLEKRKVFYSLLKHIEVPPFLLEFFNYLKPTPHYKTNWENNYLDEKTIILYFLNDYIRYLKMNWRVEYKVLIKCLSYKFYIQFLQVIIS